MAADPKPREETTPFKKEARERQLLLTAATLLRKKEEEEDGDKEQESEREREASKSEIVSEFTIRPGAHTLRAERC